MIQFRSAAKRGLMAGVAVLLLAPPASAETLADALGLAYRTNPDLQGARADLRAVDEDYVQARAGYGPQAQITVGAQYSNAEQRNLFGQQVTSESNTGTANIAIAQPLYTGGRVGAQVTRSLRDIDSERERLRAVEAAIMFEVIAAYSDVRRDQQALAIRQTTLETYRRVVDEITARMRAGELTRTDVAEAQSQLESERGLVNNAMAQLEASRAAYAAVVGQNPGVLEATPALPNMPANADEAFAAANTVNPQIRRALFQAESASARVAEARAAYRPNISLRATYGSTGSIRPFQDYDDALVGQITVTQPLFSSGVRGSAVRQAQARTDSTRAAVDSTRRSVVQSVANAWNAMVTARDNRIAAAAAVSAAETAVQGMRIEFRADMRSTFEVLNAEERLNSARLFLLGAEHDEYVAAARLLAEMGRLEAGALLQDMPLYDAAANLAAVRHKGALPTEGIPAFFDRIATPKGAEPTPPLAIPTPAVLRLRPAVDAPSPNAPLTTASPVAKPTTVSTGPVKAEPRAKTVKPAKVAKAAKPAGEPKPAKTPG